MLTNGYAPLTPFTDNKLPDCAKNFKRYQAVITLGGDGAYGDFKLTANLYYVISGI